MASIEQRVMRIAVPVPLIREMDSVIINGIGGYATRAEFILDAIQERLLELTTSEVEDSGPPPMVAGVSAPTPSATKANNPTDEKFERLPTPSTTEISIPRQGFTLEAVDDLARPEGLPLFGLHNRDYPSLWALAVLAALAVERPIPVEGYYTKVTGEAWKFGEQLLAVEKKTGIKRTALFPTNPEKRKAAEMGFRAFAIGDYRPTDDHHFICSGPLFEWRVAGLIDTEGAEPLIGMTVAGWEMLTAIAGITVDEPHHSSASDYFLRHLQLHSPADYAGFVEVLRAIGLEGASRQEVLHHTESAWPGWTKNEVSTNAAGYTARAREWGLVEQKQSKKQYHLTPFGINHLKGLPE